jgi:hypothetical protein
MLLFIVPLRNPSTCRDWPLVSRLCERTLRSLCQQTSPEFRVFLVCKERPQMEFSHPALTIIEEDFPDPGDEHLPREQDKWRKLKRGLIAARSFAAAHVMFTDADDCVHRDLAAVVAREPASAGWFFATGYMHEAGTRWLWRRREFHRFCGTSAMVRCEVADFPETMDDPTDSFRMLTYGHTAVHDFMLQRGTPLQGLPFAGAVYEVGTGENHSGFSLNDWKGKKIFLNKLFNSRPLTAGMRQTFGLYDVDAARVATNP